MIESILALLALFWNSIMPMHEWPAGTAYDPKVECGQHQWVVPPQLGDDGVFSGALFSDCVFREAAPEGFDTLDAYLIRETESSADKIHQGPIQETYHGLPGVKYDLTVSIHSDMGDVKVRQWAHVANDSRTQLEYATDSQDVQGTGNAQYLRKMDLSLVVSAGTSPGSYGVRVSSGLQVKKPWFIPGGLFKSKMEEGFIDQFKGKRDEWLPVVARNL